LFCDSNLPDGWISNNDDLYPNCTSNLVDCNGICGGTSELDECGICDGDGAGTTCWDQSLACSLDDCPETPENYPDWDSDFNGVLDNFNEYQNNGSITSAVFMDSLNAGSMGDVLAAFVEDEIRGVAIPTEVPFGPYAGTHQFLMLVYSNVAAGETIDFQFYDYETDTVYDVTQSYEFVSDMILGNVISPEILDATLAIDIDVPLAAGWNWMSLNVHLYQLLMLHLIFQEK
jgi:hypothetical protein